MIRQKEDRPDKQESCAGYKRYFRAKMVNHLSCNRSGYDTKSGECQHDQSGVPFTIVLDLLQKGWETIKIPIIHQVDQNELDIDGCCTPVFNQPFHIDKRFFFSAFIPIEPDKSTNEDDETHPIDGFIWFYRYESRKEEPFID